MWFLLPFLAVGGLIGYSKYRANQAANAAPTQQTTSTAGFLPPWLPSWGGFTEASLQNTTKLAQNTQNSLNAISNNFGLNDGGNNPGVSTGGSGAGGVQSSGSGAGLPVTNNAPIVPSGTNDSGSVTLNGYDGDDANDIDYGD